MFSTPARITLTAALLTCALVPMAALAADGKIQGGPGGGGFRDQCPPGQYIVGVQLRSGSWVDSVTPVCGVFKPGMGAQGGPRQKHGGNGGGPQAANCPNGSFVTELRMGFTVERTIHPKYLDYVQMTCTSATNASQSSKVCLQTGDGCYTNVNSQRVGPMSSRCPDNEAANGMIGRSGKYVDALGITCAAKPSTRPSRQALVCRNYADTALAAATENKNLGCGQSGGRWSTDVNSHYSWCVGLKDADIHFMDSEAAARKQALTQCKASKKLPTTGCNPPHVLYKNGTCGCPSGLRGPKCDEIIVN